MQVYFVPPQCVCVFPQMEERHRRMQASVEAERQARLARMVDQAAAGKREAQVRTPSELCRGKETVACLKWFA